MNRKLLVILGGVFALIFLGFVFNQNYREKLNLEKQVEMLRTQNYELDKQLSQMLAANRACGSMQHNCNLVAEDRETILASYRKTNGARTYTYRLSLPDSWDLMMYSSGEYFANFYPDGEHSYGVNINKEGPENRSKKCIFNDLVKEYGNINTEFGVLRVGILEDQLNETRLERFWLCEQAGSGEWINETGIGMIDINMLWDHDTQAPDESFVNQTVQVIRNIDVTSIEEMY